jgi:hypothetical protein
VHRDRSVRWLTRWVFVAALLLKGAVPMLASAAAALQGKPLAEVCALYGIDTSKLRAPARVAAAVGSDGSDVPAARGVAHDDSRHNAHPPYAHDAHDAHDPRAAHDAPDASAPHHAHAAPGEPAHDGPARLAHGSDHCALTALAFAVAAGLVTVAPTPPAVASLPTRRASVSSAVDPVARWAAQLRHGPPASS